MDEHDLTGWKEIAAFLRVSERTAQRFERELGLPVVRVREAKGAFVRAVPSELRAWLERARDSAPDAREGAPAPALPAGRRRWSTAATAVLILGLLGVVGVVLTRQGPRRSSLTPPNIAARRSVELEFTGIRPTPLRILVVDGGEAVVARPSGFTLKLAAQLRGNDLVLDLSQALPDSRQGYRPLASVRLGLNAPGAIEVDGEMIGIVWRATHPTPQ